MPSYLSPPDARQASPPPRAALSAIALGIISTNELRAGYQPMPAFPRKSHVPPRPMPAPAPSPSRTTVCLGCGAPSAGLVACSYCLRRS